MTNDECTHGNPHFSCPACTPREIKKCARAKVKSGRKAKRPIPHGPHDWVAGVYLPVGNIDGHWVRCPGYPDPRPEPMSVNEYTAGGTA
jgi:hypothetical protein